VPGAVPLVRKITNKTFWLFVAMLGTGAVFFVLNLVSSIKDSIPYFIIRHFVYSLLEFGFIAGMAVILHRNSEKARFSRGSSSIRFGHIKGSEESQIVEMRDRALSIPDKSILQMESKIGKSSDLLSVSQPKILEIRQYRVGSTYGKSPAPVGSTISDSQDLPRSVLPKDSTKGTQLSKLMESTNMSDLSKISQISDLPISSSLHHSEQLKEIIINYDEPRESSQLTDLHRSAAPSPRQFQPPKEQEAALKYTELHESKTNSESSADLQKSVKSQPIESEHTDNELRESTNGDSSDLRRSTQLQELKYGRLQDSKTDESSNLSRSTQLEQSVQSKAEGSEPNQDGSDLNESKNDETPENFQP